MPPSPQDSTHDASCQGPDGLPPADVLETGVGARAAKLAATRAAVVCPAPGTYGADLCCNDAPIRAAGVADGFL
jgi:hypothetical protein